MTSVSIQNRPVPEGVQPQEGGRLQCLECGRWYRALGSHLVQSEQIELDVYRERHGLPATLPLAAPDLRARFRHLARQRREQGDLLAAPAPDVARAARRTATIRRAQTAVRPGVRAIHRAGIVSARTRAAEAARARLDEIADRLGHPDWPALIAATRHHDTGALAELAGRDRQTITYWRRKVLGPDWQTTSGYLNPNRAAAYARLEAEFAARGWTDLTDALTRTGTGIKRLASDLATTPATLRAWDGHRTARPT